MPVPKGQRYGGRQKGTTNKVTQEARGALGPLILRAKETAQQILDMTLPCSVCRGAGKTEFQPAKGHSGVRRCQSCWGSGKEKVSPELRARIALDALEYGNPKLRAIEHTGVDGGPIQLGVRVISVKAGPLERTDSLD